MSAVFELSARLNEMLAIAKAPGEVIAKFTGLNIPRF